MNYATLPRTGR